MQVTNEIKLAEFGAGTSVSQRYESADPDLYRYQNVTDPQHCIFLYTSVADPDPGSGIGCLFDPWIRDPGWEKVSIRIRDEQPGSYFLELRNHFFAFLGVKILKFFDEDPGWRQFGSGIRDGKKSDPG